MDKIKLAAKELRVSTPTPEDILKIKRREIYIICEDVMDTYNVGAIFRLADAVGASCVYLCGGSETPPNSQIAKASVGCDKWVPWQYEKTAEAAIKVLKSRVKNLKVFAVEQGKGSVEFKAANYSLPLAFVVGHETRGISKETLKICDTMVEIPVYGVNISLNVMVSLAIVLFNSL